MKKKSIFFLIIVLLFNIIPTIPHVQAETDILYVEDFNDIIREWTETGSSPWLNDNTENELSSSTDNDYHREFTFADHAGSESINSVTFYIELKGPSARNDKCIVTMQIQDGGGWLQIIAQDPDANDYAWYNADLSVYANTWTKINYAKIRIEYEKSGSPSTQTIYARRSYILVDYTPEEVLPPSDPNLLFGAGFNASSPYVELHWNHSLVDVQFFEVQNSSDKISWTYLGQSTTTNYTDNQVVNGIKRYYKVRACNQTDSTWYNSSFLDVNFEKVYFILEIGDGVVGAGFPPEALIMLIFLLLIAFIWLYGVSRKK